MGLSTGIFVTSFYLINGTKQTDMDSNFNRITY